MIRHYIFNFLVIISSLIFSCQTRADPFDSILESLENNFGFNITEDYQNNKKWLLGIKVNSSPISETAIYFDVADYIGLTNEGNANYGDGKEWITVWVDNSVGLGITGLISFFPIEFDLTEPDPLRNQWVLNLAELEISGFRLESFSMKDVGNGNVEASNFTFKNGIGIEVNLLDFGTNTLRFEIEKSTLRQLIKSAMRESLSSITFPKNIFDRLITIEKFRPSINSEIFQQTRLFTSTDNEQYLENEEHFAAQILAASTDSNSNNYFPISPTVLGLPVRHQVFNIEYSKYW